MAAQSPSIPNAPVALQGGFVKAPTFWQRYISNSQVMVGTFIVLLLIFSAVLAPLLTPYDPTRLSPRDRFQSPSLEHPFGTDQLGRDVLARILYGAQVSLVVGIAAVALSAIIGTTLGAISGYFGGPADTLIMRLTDTFLAIPGLVLTIGMVAVLGPGLDKLVISIAVSSWPTYTRLVRGSYLSIKQLQYIEAAQSIGVRTPRIMFRHILPNAVGPILVIVMIGTAGAIITEAGLSFLGVGLEPRIPTWGRMLAEAQEYIRQYAYLSIFPGVAIMILTLGFNLLGEGLRDIFDPKQRKR
jgi:peptide/nickel transport system permease protein